MEISPGKYQTKGGKYALILSEKTMGQGSTRFWHGQLLSSLTSRSGLQNAWNLDGSDMGGNPDLEIVEPAFVTSEALH
jgi:hypothetical protein